MDYFHLFSVICHVFLLSHMNSWCVKSNINALPVKKKRKSADTTQKDKLHNVTGIISTTRFKTLISDSIQLLVLKTAALHWL